MSALAIPELDAPALIRFGGPELVYGAAPAAGADFSAEVEAGYFMRLISVFCRLVTDANVADRELVVECRDGQDQRFALFGAPVTVSASDTVDYAFSAYQPRAEWPVDDSIIVPLGPVLLVPSWDFRLHVVNVQAGDQLSRIRYMRERFYPLDARPSVA